MKPLLVGEANPYGSDPEFALYPLPAHASGGRLARIFGLGRTEYLRTFDRMNLCEGRFTVKAAREAARKVWQGGAADRRHVVLLGRKVGDAFGALKSWGWFESFFILPADEARGWPKYTIMPHPSGLCRVWAEPDAVPRARALLGALLKEAA